MVVAHKVALGFLVFLLIKEKKKITILTTIYQFGATLVHHVVRFHLCDGLHIRISQAKICSLMCLCMQMTEVFTLLYTQNQA